MWQKWDPQEGKRVRKTLVLQEPGPPFSLPLAPVSSTPLSQGKAAAAAGNRAPPGTNPFPGLGARPGAAGSSPGIAVLLSSPTERAVGLATPPPARALGGVKESPLPPGTLLFRGAGTKSGVGVRGAGLPPGRAAGLPPGRAAVTQEMESWN